MRLGSAFAGVRIRQYVRRSPKNLHRRRAAVPKWTQKSFVPGREIYHGRYKNRRLYIQHLGVMGEDHWYWEVEDQNYGVLAQGKAKDAGAASRQAELAAGYEYASKFFPVTAPVLLGTKVTREIGEF